MMRWILTLTLFCCHNFSFAQDKFINQFGIATEGIRETDKLKALKLWPELAARDVGLSTLDQLIRYLMKTENYASVSIESTATGAYKVNAIALKRIKAIEFFGNVRFDDDDIRSVLNLKTGSQLSQPLLMRAGERVKEFYGTRGYFNTIVSFDVTDAGSNEVLLRVRIRERTPCLVKDIEIKSNNTELKNRLSRRMQKFIDRNFTEENTQEIETILTDYLRENRFINAKLTQDEARYNNSKTAVVLVYEIIDSYAYEVILHGNVFYNATEIIKSINFDEISRGSGDPAQTITQMVRNHYTKTGFHHVKVYSDEKRIEKTSMHQVHIYITEGARVRIKTLEVVGRISKPSTDYVDFLYDNSSEAISDRIYVRDDIENGIKNLIIDLNNQGYLKAKAQSTRVEYNEKLTEAKVTVVIDEGPLTQLQKISFYGVKSFAETQLLKVINIQKGSPLHLNDLEAGILALKQFYYDHGFLEMRLQNEDDSLIEYDERGLQATLHFRVIEGPQIYVRAIKLEGNTFTKDYVLIREAAIDVGDLVTPELIDEAQKRLDKLAIFSRVEIRTLEQNSDISQRTLLINVIERNPGIFKFGAGITNKRDLTARGFTLISYNNLWGTARAVSLRTTIENNLVRDHYLEYEATAGYLEPFLLNKRVRGRALYTRSEKIFEGTDEPDLLATDSVNFILERDLTSRIKFSWLFWGYDSVEKFKVPSTGPLERQSRQEIAYIGPSIDIDYTDNLFMPTMGSYTRLDAEYAAPELGSSEDIQFVRTQARYTHHLRIAGSPKYVWANSFHTGYEKNLSTHTNSGVPMSFAFFLGGQNTVRGYSGTSGDRIPSDNLAEHPIGDTEHKNQLIIPGESTYYLVKSEVRFPLWVEPFGGVLFYDAGKVNFQDHFGDSGNRHSNPDETKQSYGLGVRLNTPVGPISLDYARKVSPRKDESPDQWHLSIGTF